MAILKSNNPLTYYTTQCPSKPGAKGIQWSLEVRRALILGKRASTIIEEHINPAPNVSDQPIIEEAREKLIDADLKRGGGGPNTVHHFTIGSEIITDAVYIVDLGEKGNTEIDIIKLPFVPKELNYNSESSYVAIKPIGRNNPYYHYTGSEDLLQFEIDWHSFNQDRKDVIQNCRKIEALSKGDGSYKSPSRIMLKWGKINLLFRDHIFIILKAPYKMTLFNKAQMNGDFIERTSMLPIQAYQSVTLARITTNNLRKKDIQYVPKYN